MACCGKTAKYIKNLSNKQKATIKLLSAKGMGINAIAIKFNVNLTAIQRILVSK